MQTDPHDRGKQRHGEETKKRERETETVKERHPGGETWIIQSLPCGAQGVPITTNL